MRLLFGILLFAGIGAIAYGLGALAPENERQGLTVAGAGALTCLALAIWAPRILRERAALQKQADIKRAEDLAERISMTGEAINVSGVFRSLVLTLLATAVPVLVVAIPEPPPPFVIGMACFFGILAMFGWLSVIPRLTAPTLSLTRTGMKTALYGFVPWEEVKGIYLSEATSKGVTIFHLEVLVPEIARLRSQMHPFGRVFRALAFGQSRTVIRFSLSRKEAVFTEHLALALLKRATGRSNRWVPGMPELRADLEREEKFFEELKRIDISNDPERALELLRQHEAEKKTRQSK